MSKRHQIRQLALQMLYQLDARGEDDREQIEQSIHDAPHGDTTKREAIDLAHAAWRGRDTLDKAVAELAPDWPTHRQPPVDRAILRLAGFELAEGLTPTAVVIDEAVELAKEFGSERSPAFINGVLDKIAKQPHAKTNPDTPKNQPLAIKINKENDQ
ncbi:transcription antitermination factor NusB [Planctomycetales bacterium ZRK34]|nr:transcription antitermination factor NusB [Planctomycetales bacterium ZRK34]